MPYEITLKRFDNKLFDKRITSTDNIEEAIDEIRTMFERGFEVIRVKNMNPRITWGGDEIIIVSNK